MKPVVLMVLDGWGFREDPIHNAVKAAHTPHFDQLWENCPHSLLEASGEHVGLPDGQMGNSEIGHTTIGAGKAIDTDLVRIAKAISNGDFAENSALQALFKHVKKHDSMLHVQGLVSPGGVHSHSDHLYAFLKIVKQAGIKKVAIHAFTDGRDTAPRSAAQYLRELEAVLQEVGIGHIATVSGRFYAMDRDTNWHRLARFEEVLAAKGAAYTQKPSEVLEQLYTQEKLDEHLEPMVFVDAENQTYPLQAHDSIFIFNFRSDRSRQLTQKLLEKSVENDWCIATMTQYDPNFPVLVVFPPVSIETTLAQEISRAGLTQAHLAETEKFPHATYFLNGGREKPHDGEEHIMLNSRKDVPTHDLAPKMRAEAIADEAIKRVEAGVDFEFINFANPDMVGHTGNVPAILEALEEVDAQFYRVVEAVQKVGGAVLITADHGNAEVNVDIESGEKHTAHTTNPVPLILVGKNAQLQSGTLADLAPTTLELLGLPIPAVMTGKNLLR